LETEHNKTITFTDLAKYVLSTYCMPKIMRDVDKPDPLTESFGDLKRMFSDEFVEKNLARMEWNESKTEDKANAYIEEIADQINILLFEAGKVAGYQRMKRE
jgi:hypothetical protein